MDGIQRTINLKKFLTPLSRDTKELQELAETETVEFQELWNVLCDIFDNQYITYMTGYGLSQWEKIFDVTPKASDNLRIRRARILQLLMGTRPYTLESFQDMLNRIYGDGNVTIQLDGNNYEIWFNLKHDFDYRAKDVKDFAEIIVPKNLIIGMKNTTETAGKQYVGAFLHHKNTVQIDANTDVQMEDFSQAQSVSGYVCVNTNITI